MVCVEFVVYGLCWLLLAAATLVDIVWYSVHDMLLAFSFDLGGLLYCLIIWCWVLFTLILVIGSRFGYFLSGFGVCVVCFPWFLILWTLRCGFGVEVVLLFWRLSVIFAPCLDLMCGVVGVWWWFGLG